MEVVHTKTSSTETLEGENLYLSSPVFSIEKELSQVSSKKNINFSAFSKRTFDIAFSAAALLCLSPVLVAIGIGIRFSSPGKIIYSQPRVGKGGKVFACYKFRSMVSNAEESLERILKSYPLLRREWEQKQKLRRDPRVFPLGKFLRKTSLDELPQFWNVLKGDLSVVGARPYMVNQIKELGPYAKKILSLRPGITGLWQTSGRSSTTFRKRITLDAEYIDNRSFWYDFYLILRTIPVVFFPKNSC